MIVSSAVVPTEYDVEHGRAGSITLVDDRGRRFQGRTLQRALHRAEAAQDPSDPIHHPPYPSAADAPLSRKVPS